MALFERLFTRVLKPWYAQPKWEPVFLFRDHTPLRLFPSVLETAEQLLGISTDSPDFDCHELGVRLPNPFRFLNNQYPRRASESRLWYTAICHGDLNLEKRTRRRAGQPVRDRFLRDAAQNAVSDFARLEAVLKFEMTRVDNDEDLTASRANSTRRSRALRHWISRPRSAIGATTRSSLARTPASRCCDAARTAPRSSRWISCRTGSRCSNGHTRRCATDRCRRGTSDARPAARR